MTKKDLFLISNFTEQNLYPVNQFNYMSYELNNKEEFELKKKQINRNIKINNILGEENKEDEIYEDEIYIDYEFIQTIGMKLSSITISSITYNKIDDIYIYILKELEKITVSNSIVIQNSKILHKISQLQNIIHIKSRIGIGNTIICGLNAYSELIKYGVNIGSFDKNGMYNIYKMNVISSDLISKNKIVVSRFGSNIESGLNTILDEKSKKFCTFTTHCWGNNISWFEIN